MHRAYQPIPHVPRRRVSWLALVPWVLAAYALSGLYAVRTDERAVVRRCGKAFSDLQLPGLHCGLPYGVDRVTRLKVFQSKRAGVGMSLAERSLGRRVQPQEAEWLTADHNLIVLSAVVQYRIADPKQYLFNVADVDALVSDVAASALTSRVTSMKIDDVLTVQRLAIQEDVKRAAQEVLNRYQAGVELTAVSLESAAPPQEVADAFRDVTAAREDRERTENEALGYANRLIPEARGEAQRVLIDADAYREEVTEKARGDAERFTKMAGELSENRRLTTRRLILETMEKVLPRLKKIVLDDQAAGGVDLGIIEADQ
jgi:membrane protease subunit HflK